MKLGTSIALLTYAVAGSAWAQKTATDVTDAQVADYKRAAETACRDGGKQQGDPPARVEAFCGCMMETLNKNMTPAEWKQVVVYARNNQAKEERDALTPHLQKLAVCRPET
jgi:hypothetical protein